MPLSFGCFKIVACVNENKSLTVSMSSEDPQVRSSYVHPHVTAEGSACLGNASTMILQSLLSCNYGMVVRVVDKFLTHYNKQDPYLPLSHWVPSMYHTPMCECGLRLITACACDRCKTCFSLMTDKEERYSYPFTVKAKSSHGCGSCSACCNAYHLQKSGDLAETGINGSPCYTANITRPEATT